MFEDNRRIEVFPFDGNGVDGWHIVIIRLFQHGCSQKVSVCLAEVCQQGSLNGINRITVCQSEIVAACTGNAAADAERKGRSIIELHADLCGILTQPELVEVGCMFFDALVSL